MVFVAVTIAVLTDVFDCKAFTVPKLETINVELSTDVLACKAFVNAWPVIFNDAPKILVLERNALTVVVPEETKETARIELFDVMSFANTLPEALTVVVLIMVLANKVSVMVFLRMFALLATSKAKPAPLINTFAKADTSPISEEVLATIVEPKIAAPVTDNPVPAPFRIKVPLSLV